MRITATYIGSSGSGYIRGQRYNLQVSERSVNGFGATQLQVDSPVKIPYANLAEFLRAWQSVSKVGDP